MRSIAGGGVTVAIVTLAVLPAVASARATVIPSTVGGSISVPGGGSRALTLACPKTAVALHAAPVRLPGGVRVTESGPGSEARLWKMSFASVARARRRVSATLRCVRLNVPRGVTGVALKVSSDSRFRVRVPARSGVDIDIRCPAGYLPTGQGVGMSTRAVRLAAAVPNRRGWTFRVENTGGSPTRASARIRCLQRIAVGSRNGARTTLAFGIQRISYDAPLASGTTRSITGSCAPDRFSLGTGTSLDGEGEITLLGSYPFDRREGSWSFHNGGAPQQVTNYLLCLSRTSRFR